MTLDQHTLQGVPKITSKTLPKADFEQILMNAGYTQVDWSACKGRSSQGFVESFKFPQN